MSLHEDKTEKEGIDKSATKAKEFFDYRNSCGIYLKFMIVLVKNDYHSCTPDTSTGANVITSVSPSVYSN